MPIYEYKCGECGHHLEAIQKMSDEPLKDCPACGRPVLQRLVSAAGFQLKGSGWYQTDFKNNGQKKDQKKDQADNKSTFSDGGEAAPAKKAHSCGGGTCGCAH